MPRFPVSFGKRRSTAESYENAPVAEPSFRVLERTDTSNVKSFDGGKRLPPKAHQAGKVAMSVDLTPMDDNIFADLKTNRGSGVSNNTAKSSLTDNSSRHSNASTAPSSTTDPSPLDDTRVPARKQYGEIPVPPIPKSSPNNFLKAAGRTFSFGGAKKSSPPASVPEEPMPRPFTADVSPEQLSTVGRARATTSSTTSTATPPKLEEEFDLGGDFSKMLSFDKRQSVLTLKDDAAGRQALGPRSLTGSRLNQPAPLHIDKSSRIEASPLSWNSHNSGEGLLATSPNPASPATNENMPPPVPRHGSNKPATSPGEPGLKRRSATYGHRNSAEGEDEDTSLLKDISTASKFLSGGSTPSHAPGRYRRNEDTLGTGFRQVSSDSRLSRLDSKEDDNLFDTSLAASSRLANRYVSRRPSPPRNKVMTPAQFERYRQDKERQGSDSDEARPSKDNDDEDEINYDDDEDETEKSKQAAKQRRKQEAHMAVYRQQMMKVTGEPATSHLSRPSISMSFSTPNLVGAGGPSPPKSSANSDGDEEDEEVPLAILAAHGFPNKNRPPTRLSTMMSNPNLKAAAQTPSYQRPGSVIGDAPGAPAHQSGGGGGGGGGGRLPVFARNLPQDPYVGAGLINHAPRESLSFSGGSPAPGVPPGGLVGVIASEERSRALRRGSPAIDAHKPMLSISNSTGFDPLAGIPSQMMYPNAPQPLSTTDQAQLQMNQQMTQFMQMQMQFMQMMANQGAGSRMSQVMPNAPMGMMGGFGGMGGPENMRHSFMDNGSVYDLPIRPESHMRSMSMVQPSSASWIQPPPNPGYAPSIRIQGVNGYAPSIAPSERSNVGLPGRYRPVSHMPAPKPSISPPSVSPADQHARKSSTMSGALGGWDQQRTKSPLQNSAAQASDEDDDEQGWAAMKQKREKKRSLWKSKKSIGSEISALIR